MHIYDDITGIGEILHATELLDDEGLVRLQDAEVYIRDRLAQDRENRRESPFPKLIRLPLSRSSHK